jgi:hypothetical protein
MRPCSPSGGGFRQNVHGRPTSAHRQRVKAFGVDHATRRYPNPGDGWHPVTSMTLDPPMSAKAGEQSGERPSEEAMYIAVTRAWFLLVSWDQRREHPMEPYVFGPQFVRSVIAAPVGAGPIATVCAKLACRFPWERGSSEPAPLLGPPVAPTDPLSTWWRALGPPEGLGVHYDELAGGVFEFLSVGSYMDRPPPGFRRR